MNLADTELKIHWGLIQSSLESKQFYIYFLIQWKPLNVITDNVIIRLMLSVLQVPSPSAKTVTR